MPRIKLVNGERKLINEGGIPIFIRVSMDIDDKGEFMTMCKRHALNASEVVRRLIKGFVDSGGQI